MATTAKRVKDARKPKFSSRKHNRCKLCGRPRGYLRKFGVCRLCFRGTGAQGRDPRRREVELVRKTVVSEQWSVVSSLAELTDLSRTEGSY